MQHINKLINLQSEHIFYYLNHKNEICIKKKPIHKISKMNFFIRNELTNISKMKKIANYKNFYYVCENSSELKISQIGDNIMEFQELKSDENVLMQFDNIELIYLNPYLRSLSSSTKHVYTLITFYKTLLKSVDLLVGQQIVHNNINFQTIAVNNQLTPLLTNFTLSIDTSNPNIPEYIQHFFIEYDPSYLEWPLEFHFISYLLTNKLNGLSNNNIETIINDVTEHHAVLKTFGDEIVSSNKEESILYFKKYVNKSYEYILTDMLHYYYTWDNYALSILFLRILIGIHRTIEIKNKFIILFMKLLVNNIHLNPIKRLNCANTIKQFDSLLDNLDPQDYKEVISALMST